MPATGTVPRGDDIMIDSVDYDGLADRSLSWPDQRRLEK
jgi:hypothetical protein